MVTKKVTLDTWHKNNVIVNANQGEVNSRFLEITLVNGGEPLNLEGATVLIYATKPDGNVIFNNCTIENIEKGIISVCLTSQMSAKNGKIPCEIHVINNKKSTLKFMGLELKITHCANLENAVESTSEFTALQEAMVQYAEFNKINSLFKGKKMNCLGDSITYGYIPGSGSKMSNPYPNVVKELLGLSTVRNYGISGSSLAVGGDNPMVTRYTSMDNDADIVCVFGGTNDWGKSENSKKRPLGTIDSTDNTTIYGALNEICAGLITKYPKATIFLITPLHRTNENKANTHGYILEDVVMAVKEIGTKFGIPVLDLFSNCNFYPANSTQNTNCSGDGLHPNQWFHQNVLGVKIAEFIRGGCVAGGAVTNDELTDGSVTTEKIASSAVTTEKIASGASIDKWKNWKHYDGIEELNLTVETCTLNDICARMVSKSRMTFAGDFSSYTTLASELPWNRGQLVIQKLDDLNCHLEFYAEDLPANTGLHTAKRWVGQWRKTGNLTNFMGWYQVFTQSELIPLNAINTGEYEDNLFNIDDCEDDCYYSAASGNRITFSSASSSGLISVVPGDKLVAFVNTSTSSNHQFVFYDTNGDYLTGFKRGSDANKEIDFEVPKGAVSMRFSFFTQHKSYIKLGHKSIRQDKLRDYVMHIAEEAVTNDKLTDGSVTTEKIAGSAVTTEKIASGASIDKWKNWKHYDGIEELNLTSETCTLNDICSGMAGRSRMTFASNFSSYTTLVSELPWSRGQLIIQKLDSWNCHLEFYAEDLPSNTGLHTAKRWVGQWRKTGNLTNFMGWYQVFTQSELIPLNVINTGEYQDNLFNSDDCEDNCYYDASTGNKTTYSGSSSSGLISVVPMDKLFVFVNRDTSNHQFTFYDTNGDYLTGFKRIPDTNKEIDFEVPKGAASMRFSFFTTNKSYVKLGHKSITQDKLSDYIKSIVNSILQQ